MYGCVTALGTASLLAMVYIDGNQYQSTWVYRPWQKLKETTVDGKCFLCVIVLSLPYNIKHMEAIWPFVLKTIFTMTLLSGVWKVYIWLCERGKMQLWGPSQTKQSQQRLYRCETERARQITELGRVLSPVPQICWWLQPARKAVIFATYLHTLIIRQGLIQYSNTSHKCKQGSIYLFICWCTPRGTAAVDLVCLKHTKAKVFPIGLLACLPLSQTVFCNLALDCCLPVDDICTTVLCVGWLLQKNQRWNLLGFSPYCNCAS